eukprot:COSAG06_NODE_581_length_14007_cov_3.569056_15_plen_49_part_00
MNLLCTHYSYQRLYVDRYLQIVSSASALLLVLVLVLVMLPPLLLDTSE